eukprot:gb/GEZN01013727.1/.p1 GENE.gb/GEZN01013727.1/~~gb/GEZN01013727.1/.p1  ORF type:complete len:174 (-),score=13.26 gb/GEZN01013727.1/:409-930(-)
MFLAFLLALPNTSAYEIECTPPSPCAWWNFFCSDDPYETYQEALALTNAGKSDVVMSVLLFPYCGRQGCQFYSAAEKHPEKQCVKDFTMFFACRMTTPPWTHSTVNLNNVGLAFSVADKALGSLTPAQYAAVKLGEYVATILIQEGLSNLMDSAIRGTVRSAVDVQYLTFCHL